ncbi:GlsB/YeaQ/YmgE family stress response membrane protein [Mesorhizobium sp. B283B1A]|uniref:GlsB/YeaQ/YmgE family stress response membrane protein n=1 Tax=Mesorhizobium opportunistum TaxID=593909 RepID=A0ABV1Y8Y8_9HYPH|nr:MULTISPECIES: GlsB/YeaQ/YmgE family stress response membrane protein [Mesorhizobium]MCA0048420.1 GlsB/YeaQ/YmgE family stress response membrane protein [Mesorhizobium sp. B283B1A]TIN98433.1 MAG: GlsB/YeaQ/YmgE family stress response membrane protein [Mesorhizobium sp.]TJU95798.1 MAG: GlsB/YeaQ/YmgE family stress response membrane protein [Mesorhizobium sp.]TJV03873.1 MAG: GlsB/YeaQ/YmgE family stress response membrane protein [Mesorhizobium sp.]TJV15202.1 MAG: GlsB/YeaQ/YmgE family stress r
MGVESLLVFIIVGAIAGWLAGLIVSGFGFGLIGNIIVGIVGAFIAGWLFPRIGFSIGGGVIASIIHATIGAIILLVLVKVLKRA